MALKLKVETRNLETQELESEKVIDHDVKEDRVWLGRHCYWAFRNNRSILTYPTE